MIEYYYILLTWALAIIGISIVLFVLIYFIYCVFFFWGKGREEIKKAGVISYGTPRKNVFVRKLIGVVATLVYILWLPFLHGRIQIRNNSSLTTIPRNLSLAEGILFQNPNLSHLDVDDLLDKFENTIAQRLEVGEKIGFISNGEMEVIDITHINL
ncbi:MAG: hypothetical protein HUU38_04160 [Anaerolineales bacterium]|nr:hypothetical protein [Anaerolineales bacterium]